MLDGDVRVMNERDGGLSCSRTERAGHRYCCWEGQGDPSRTATHLGLSALGEAGKQIGNSRVKSCSLAILVTLKTVYNHNNKYNIAGKKSSVSNSAGKSVNQFF